MTLYEMLLLTLIYLVGILEAANYLKESADTQDERYFNSLVSVMWPLTVPLIMVCHVYFAIKYLLKKGGSN